MTVLPAIGQSLAEGFFMFWATLWALIFGFTLLGVVQAFVSRHEMQRAMGDHRPGTVLRTGFLGAASSSCSYAATALAKSLFQRGADFTTAMVFMVASSNLVIALGVVLWLLIGWQFALAEFVGGAIMITLFVLVAPHVFPAAELESARNRLEARAAVQGRPGGSEEAEPEALGLAARLRSKARWADAAGYAVSDVTMLRRELLIGYLVAGVLAVAVPSSAYDVVFLSGHGALTELENVIVGPLVAFISFVCSIGNVPLAAALVKGGLSFGGTVAFVFADLITVPLVMVVIYGKFYGRAPRAAAVLLVLGGDERRGPGHGPALPGAPHPGPRPGAGHRRHALPVELHHLSQHCLPGRGGGGVLVVPEPGPVWRRRRLRQGHGVRDAGGAGARPGHPRPRRPQLLLLL